MLVRINHHQPQQVRARTLGKREVLLHEPPRQTVLRARHACGLGRYGKLLPGTLRDDQQKDMRKGRYLLYLYG